MMKLYPLVLILIILKPFAMFGDEITESMKDTSTRSYYNPSVGYLFFKDELLYVYVPEMEDSTRYFNAAVCKYQFMDSTHIMIESLTPNYGVNSELIQIKPSQKQEYIYNDFAKVNFSFDKSKTICEFTIILISRPKESQHNKIQKRRTYGGKASFYISPDSQLKKVEISPIDYDFIPSNPQNVFYGRLEYSIPLDYHLGQQRMIDIFINGFDCGDLKRFYIPEDYMEFSTDHKTINWRGYTYFEI